jgi:hypothetical protein
MTKDDDRLEAQGDAGATWQEALVALELSLRAAAQAVVQLRRGLAAQGAAEPASPLGPQPLRLQAAPPKPRPEPRSGATFERLWERIENERLEKQQAAAQPEAPEKRRGFDLLPQMYLVTAEDRDQKVDLIALHRALLTLVPVEDINLVSFANQVPLISVRSQGELDLDKLREAVATALDRDCEVIVHDNGRLFLRLQPRQEAVV